jgi:hypothetical protein
MPINDAAAAVGAPTAAVLVVNRANARTHR